MSNGTGLLERLMNKLMAAARKNISRFQALRKMVQEAAAVPTSFHFNNNAIRVLGDARCVAVRTLSRQIQFRPWEQDVLARCSRWRVRKTVYQPLSKWRTGGCIVGAKKRNEGLVEVVVLAARDDEIAVLQGHRAQPFDVAGVGKLYCRPSTRIDAEDAACPACVVAQRCPHGTAARRRHRNILECPCAVER